MALNGSLIVVQLAIATVLKFLAIPAHRKGVTSPTVTNTKMALNGSLIVVQLAIATVLIFLAIPAR
jgi:hypothetical protein